jgi:transcriptional regulator with XRE-family HTH domain
MKIYWFNDSKNIIGKKVKEARLSASPIITQQDLCSRLAVLGVNMDRVSVSKIETGDRFVTDYEVLAISESFNLSVDWLLKSQS